MATASKRLIAYFLSFLGFDRYAYPSLSLRNVGSFYSSKSSSSTLCESTSSSSSSSFMTDSTLFVNTGKHDMYENEDGMGVTVMSYDAWTLQSLLANLPKVSLCNIIATTAAQYPKIMRLVEDQRPLKDNKSSDVRWPYFASFCDMNVSYMQDDDPNDIVTMHCRELEAIRVRAHTIVHSMDHQRPSERFANEVTVSQELERLVRLCTNTLHTASQGYTLIAMIGLSIVASEALEGVSMTKRHVFSDALLGRVLILEMASILKNYKAPPRELQPTRLFQAAFPDQQDDFGLAGFVQLVTEVCARLAQYDLTWQYRQEYDSVPSMAARHLQ
ncbi:hypothetical protein VTP01DRAFT_4849 [Rhizomucor pusillus]|uniref:uncharacterized protein n=1 Tax=Rhizomucor pusillus TaxID=4840 RepID=UPI003744277B